MHIKTFILLALTSIVTATSAFAASELSKSVQHFYPNPIVENPGIVSGLNPTQRKPFDPSDYSAEQIKSGAETRAVNRQRQDESRRELDAYFAANRERLGKPQIFLQKRAPNSPTPSDGITPPPNDEGINPREIDGAEELDALPTDMEGTGIIRGR